MIWVVGGVTCFVTDGLYKQTQNQRVEISREIAYYAVKG